MRKRITISALIGLTTGILCTFWLTRVRIGAGDFNWAIWAAQDLLAHRNPYARPMQLYPLTASIFGFPFVRIRPELAGGIFYGISSALMAIGLTRDNYRRLFIFLAYPYWAGLITAQWTPLLVAAAFLPPLLPATLAKPQIGLPVFLTRLTRRGLLACLIVIALSFLLLPNWPHLWVGNFHEYARFIPLLVFPGPLLALALFRYRSSDARLLFLMALVPQRWFYDMLILWIIPKSWRELSMTVLISWAAGIWRWYHIPHSFTEVGRIAVIFLYLPMLAIVLLRTKSAPDEATVSS
jgi:hypothetical protein